MPVMVMSPKQINKMPMKLLPRKVTKRYEEMLKMIKHIIKDMRLKCEAFIAVLSHRYVASTTLWHSCSPLMLNKEHERAKD
ncbi:hypothetical protein JHK86_033420 [Glycine max]|nr:hypothetical protein JHK86_033420 [Glycine max]